MKYSCYDCSYQGNKRTGTGECPACGSFNYKTDRERKPEEEEKPKTWRLVLLVSLWAYLIGHIWVKLYG